MLRGIRCVIRSNKDYIDLIQKLNRFYTFDEDRRWQICHEGRKSAMVWLIGEELYEKIISKAPNPKTSFKVVAAFAADYYDNHRRRASRR